jgi:uncharacterized protein YchJ
MKRYLTSANVRLVLEIVLLACALVFALSRSVPTEAAPALAPENPAATNWYECVTPDQVAVFATRVHVHCASTNPTIAGVSWFAVPTSPDSAYASRVLSVFQSAMVANKRLWLYVDPSDTSGSIFGCNSGDCRRIVGAEITP